jgi:hypothetical protein
MGGHEVTTPIAPTGGEIERALKYAGGLSKQISNGERFLSQWRYHVVALAAAFRAEKAKSEGLEAALKKVSVYEIEEGGSALYVSINGAQFYVLTRLEGAVRQFDVEHRAALGIPDRIEAALQPTEEIAK